MPIRFYRYCISPCFKPHCCFHPSCSSYAITAIQRHGVLSGIWLSLKRFVRCNPWSLGGYDPVPKEINKLCNIAVFTKTPIKRTGEDHG